MSRHAGRALFTLAAVAMIAAPAAAQPAPIWRGKLARAADPDETIVITCSAVGHRVSLRRHSDDAADTAVDAGALPIATPLLPQAQAQARAYGREERCRVAVEDGRLSINCAAGQAPAGVVFGFGGRHLPRGAAMTLVSRSAGDAGFAVAVVPEGHDAGAAEPIAEPFSRVALVAQDETRAVQVVVTAPAAGGEIALTDLRLESATPRPAPTAAWAWEERRWRADSAALIEAAHRRGLERLFVSLSMRDGAVSHAAALQRFIRAARHRGIAVEAVEGDPDMAGSGLPTALARARAIAAFQAATPADARLAGIQYDIEPYVRPDWRDRDASYRQWGRNVAALGAAAAAKVDLVVPFWLASSRRGRAMLDEAAPALRMVTVMAYRSDADAVERIAEPLLAWGVRRELPVRLALEAGPLDDEVEFSFRPAVRGTLALFPDGRLLLYDRPVAIPGAQMLAATRQQPIRAASLSFLGDEARMTATAARLRPRFSAWPSFAGYAFHGLDWSRSTWRTIGRVVDRRRP